MKKTTSFFILTSLLIGILIVNSCKKDSEIPTLTTADVTNIAVSSLTSGGSITKDGGEEVTARGVCYSTSANPVVSGQHTSDDKGTGSFVSTLTGLTANTLYHIRAYATNSVGTAYGNEVTATTAPIVVPTLTTVAVTSVTLTTAVSGGNITADGNASITARGVCWATTTDPTITNSKTADGTGPGAFVSNLTGLQAATTYYIRAYATNSAGTAYGNQVTFTTTALSAPTLTTTAITSITITTAVSGGNITADGGSAVTARGVCWAATANPTTTNPKTTDLTGTGVFVSNITGLTPGATYHVRAYATNATGTAYGNDISFTAAVGVATVTTTAASAITQTTATSGGNVTTDGGATVTVRGVCWATTANPTTTNSKTTDATGTGIFTSSLTPLLPGTVYHIRAYATNSAGTAYGNDLQFTTSPVLVATVTTTAITAVGPKIASTGGNVTSDGGGAVTARGICYSTTHTTPTITDSPTTNGTGTGIFTTNLTGLSEGTIYYARAYATNSAGTGYGVAFSFSTQVLDVELNPYNTVKIGNQLWMKENLRTILFNSNSAPILNITGNAEWAADDITQTPAYCWMNNDIANKPLYGAMYNWFVINTGDLCPTGWHVPTEAEFQTLELFLGLPLAEIDGYHWRGTVQGTGTQLKSTTGWADGQNGTNTSGFSALPGGYRYAATGTFNDLGNLTYWWTATPSDVASAMYRRLDGIETGIYRAATNKGGGKYVRCVKNPN